MRWPPFLILAAVVLVSMPLTARGDEAAELYAESCSACHTIGRGDGAGPDLIASTQWSADTLRVAVERMEENTGDLTDEQVDSLVTLLKAPDLNQRLAALEQPAAETTVAQPQGSAENGRRLFFGEKPLANGGSACFACHTMGTEGGALAADLSAVHTRLSPAALVTASAKPPFAMMKAAYAQHAVTQEEAIDLAAFLGSPATSLPLTSGVVPVRVGAVSLAGVALAAIALLFRARRAGVRSRLVRDSSRRETP